MTRNLILGLCTGHNPAAAIIERGELKFAIEQEKISRMKNTIFFVKDAIRAGLKFCNAKPEDIGIVAIHSNPFDYYGLSKRQLPLKYEIIPFFYNLMLKHLMTKKLWLEHIGVNNLAKVFFYNHHKTHAAEVFYQSGFKKSAILVLDGRGESESTSFWEAEKEEIRKLRSVSTATSIGYLYLIFTAFLGFNYGDEYKVMGLASYGFPKYCKQIKDIFYNKKIQNDPYTEKLVLRAFGIIKNVGLPENSVFDKFAKNWPLTFEEKADIASSVQKATEEIVFEYLEEISKLTDCRNLCISGGVGQNSVLNGRIIRNSDFENVFLSSAPNDSGTAVGSAFLACLETKQKLNLKKQVPFLGPCINIEKLIEKIERQKWTIKKIKDPINYAAKLIREKEIIGFARGRAEFGPRALGNRSILADPSTPNLCEMVNKIKGRELFRPLAPSVKLDKANEYFVIGGKDNPYMASVFKARDKTKKIAPAVVHVDGTSRVQTVSRSDQPEYWRVLDEFEKLSDFGIILNTSLNVAGDPMAAEENGIVETFRKANLNFIIVENYLVAK